MLQALFDRASGRGFAAAIVLVLLALAYPAPASAASRVALVIGNSDYQAAGKLRNPSSDADLVSNSLQAIGFEVVVKKDLDYFQTIMALREFSANSMGAEIAIVYYAGHGVEISGINYVIPVDAKLQKPTDARLEAIELSQLVNSIEGATRLRLVVVDACRDNPFRSMLVANRGTRSVGNGLAPYEPDLADTLIAYSARGGTFALDGTGANSPFAEAFARHLGTPRLEISILFRQIRDDVLKQTQSRQEPFTYGSLSAEAIFLNASASAPDPVDEARSAIDIKPAPDEPVTPAALLGAGTLDQIKSIRDEKKLEDIVAGQPGTLEAEFARFKLASLRDPAASPLTAFMQTAPAETRTSDQLVAAATTEMGKGAAADVNAALHLLKLAAAKGTPAVMNTLGLLLYNRNDPTVMPEMYGWFMEASIRGIPEALSNLGFLYQNGLVIQTDYTIAIRLYEEAAKRGAIKEAYNQLGMIYQGGLGVTPDYKRAYEYMLKAYEAGNRMSGFNLGWYSANGIHVPRDAQKAANYFLEAIGGGVTQAVDQLLLDFAGHDFQVRTAIQAGLQERGLLQTYQPGVLDDSTRRAVNTLGGRS